MLGIAAIGPIALALVIRVGASTVTDVAPVFDLTAYYPGIVGSMVVFGSSINGFVIGMFVLEDRELGVLTAYRTSPLSARQYLVYRGVTATLLSTAATLPALAGIVLVAVLPAVLVGTVDVGALGGSLIALVFGQSRRIRSRGSRSASSSIWSSSVLRPLLQSFQFLAGVLPTYWPVEAFVAGSAGNPFWLVYLLVGVIARALALLVLGRRFANLAV